MPHQEFYPPSSPHTSRALTFSLRPSDQPTYLLNFWMVPNGLEYCLIKLNSLLKSSEQPAIFGEQNLGPINRAAL